MGEQKSMCSVELSMFKYTGSIIPLGISQYIISLHFHGYLEKLKSQSLQKAPYLLKILTC